jgi:TolB-like protein
MNKLFTSLVFGVMLAGVSLAQKQVGHTKAAVVEFTPGPNASGMTAEAKRHLQASIAFSLEESLRFDIVDVRHTREASQGTLPAVNNDSSTAAAVKVGKQLGVAYVLTGTVLEYTAKPGQAILRTRLVEVATGNVKYSGEIVQKATSPMRTAGASEMQTKVLKPAVEKLTEALTGKL